MMPERLAKLELQLQDQYYWEPAERLVRKLSSWYEGNSKTIRMKASQIACFWHRIHNITHGASGDKITLQVHSAIRTLGSRLKKAYMPSTLDKVGYIVCGPFIPLDKVSYYVKVLIDGVLVFQTLEDDKFSPLSRFLWNVQRTVFALNCEHLDLEIWESKSEFNPRAKLPTAIARLPFDFPMSKSAQFVGKPLKDSINGTFALYSIGITTDGLSRDYNCRIN
jgi:hypothetical protein